MLLPVGQRARHGIARHSCRYQAISQVSLRQIFFLTVDD